MSIIKTNDKFTYNSNSKKYVFHSEEKFGKNFVFGDAKVNQIISLYSDYDKNPLTMGEIGLKMSIPKDIVKFIINALKITHSSLPFTSEKIEEGNEDELVDEMISSKGFNIQQKFEKLDWKKTQEDADKWRGLQNNVLNPLTSILNSWTPPKYTPIKTKNVKQKDESELIIFSSDVHFGIKADERYLQNQKGWGIDDTCGLVKSYANKLVEHIETQNYSRINVCLAGDFIHSINGFTDKGTKLETDCIGSEVIEKAFDSMVDFIYTIIEQHDNIRVFAVNGNHSELGDHVLYRMLQLYFRHERRIKFEVTDKQHLFFKVYDNLFLLSHGYSSYTKNRVPQKGIARENYVNNIFMAYKDISSVDRMYALFGDQHHFESQEMTNVESFIFPSLVGGCRYGDNSGYKSRVRQNILSVKKDGIHQITNLYFD